MAAMQLLGNCLRHCGKENQRTQQTRTAVVKTDDYEKVVTPLLSASHLRASVEEPSLVKY